MNISAVWDLNNWKKKTGKFTFSVWIHQVIILKERLCVCTIYINLFLLPLKTLEATGLNVTMEDVANTDHFSIIEQLVDGEYHLTKVHMHKTQQKGSDECRWFFPECLSFFFSLSFTAILLYHRSFADNTKGNIKQWEWALLDGSNNKNQLELPNSYW